MEKKKIKRLLMISYNTLERMAQMIEDTREWPVVVVMHGHTGFGCGRGVRTSDLADDPDSGDGAVTVLMHGEVPGLREGMCLIMHDDHAVRAPLLTADMAEPSGGGYYATTDNDQAMAASLAAWLQSEGAGIMAWVEPAERRLAVAAAARKMLADNGKHSIPQFN